MNSRKILVFLLWLSMSATAQEVLTPQPAPQTVAVNGFQLSDLKVAFVNFRRILQSSPQLSAMQTMLNAEFDQQQKALRAAQNELRELERQALTHNNLQNDEALERKLIEKRRNVTYLENTLHDNYSVRRNEELTRLQRQILDEILAVAKEYGFDVILNDTGVIYVSEKADLTSLVIQRLTQSLDKNTADSKIKEEKTHDKTKH